MMNHKILVFARVLLSAVTVVAIIFSSVYSLPLLLIFLLFWFPVEIVLLASFHAAVWGANTAVFVGVVLLASSLVLFRQAAQEALQ